jgi:hypothetical protein
VQLLGARRGVVAWGTTCHRRSDAIGLPLVSVHSRAKHKLLYIPVAVLPLQLEQSVADLGRPAAAGLLRCSGM